jgi:hypothetical protein
MPRTCLNGGSSKLGCRLTIRLTHSERLALRIFWKMTVPLKPPSESLATLTAGLRNSMTAAARRFCSRTLKESGIAYDTGRKIIACFKTSSQP